MRKKKESAPKLEDRALHHFDIFIRQNRERLAELKQIQTIGIKKIDDDSSSSVVEVKKNTKPLLAELID